MVFFSVKWKTHNQNTDCKRMCEGMTIFADIITKTQQPETNCQACSDPSLAADSTEFSTPPGCQQVVHTVGSTIPATGL